LRRALGGMVIANLLSAWAGIFGMNWLTTQSLDINNLRLCFAFMLVASYALTLMIEFPLVALIFRGDPQWLRKTVRGSLIMQTASYALLCVGYGIVGNYTLLTQTTVVAPSAMRLPDNVMLWYIDARDGDVYRRPLAAGPAVKMYACNSHEPYDYLTDVPHGSETGPIPAECEPSTDTELYALAVDAVHSWRILTHSFAPGRCVPQVRFSNVPGLGSACNSAWHVERSSWAAQGIQAWKTSRDEQPRCAFETPICQWTARCITLLPGDIILCQFGEDQICAYDPERDEIALLARGHGPLPVLTDTAAAY